jgi:DNA repair exonuclease SbcCD ATPase subunit
VGIDGQKQLRYNLLQLQLTADEKAQQKSVEELTLAEGAAERRRLLIENRRSMYVAVFQSYLNEQAVLERLYAPLQESLEGASGSLTRLRLAVSREIELSAWVKAGEELLDLRKDSHLRGHGALEGHAERLLITAWRTGTAEQVGEAMQTFIKEMHSEIRKSIPTDITPEKEPAWMQRVATWLYSTDHIKMRYGVTYDGVAIEQLSPGTRGIVLLLLYLVIDQQDRRPLIIDQPEENLDPKSVFEELVPHFREVRKRRQVIIVTHNANLVVNTDADQVIVAASEPSPLGGLPTVRYRCGSLEHQNIRKIVCEILEGGERAFRDRERRYRLQREPLA